MLSNPCQSVTVLLPLIPFMVPPSPTKCFAQASTLSLHHNPPTKRKAEHSRFLDKILVFCNQFCLFVFLNSVILIYVYIYIKKKKTLTFHPNKEHPFGHYVEFLLVNRGSSVQSFVAQSSGPHYNSRNIFPILDLYIPTTISNFVVNYFYYFILGVSW